MPSKWIMQILLRKYLVGFLLFSGVRIVHGQEDSLPGQTTDQIETDDEAEFGNPENNVDPDGPNDAKPMVQSHPEETPAHVSEEAQTPEPPALLPPLRNQPANEIKKTETKPVRLNNETAPNADETAKTAGYDLEGFNGFYIQSRDKAYRLNFGAFTQLRWNINGRDAPEGEDDITTGVAANRTRIFLEGNFAQMFNYLFQFNIDSQGNWSLWNANLTYNIAKNIHIQAGLMGMPQSREDWASPQDLLTIEYSPNDFTFAQGATYGVLTFFGFERVRFWLGVNNGSYGSKFVFPQEDASRIGGIGRLEIQLAGTDWSSWNDLIGRRGRPVGLLLGIAGGYNYDFQDFENPVQTHKAQVNMDLSLSGNGYQLMAAGSWTFESPEGMDPLNHFGLMAQAGVFVSTRNQLYTQYNLLVPDGDYRKEDDDPEDDVEPGELGLFNSVCLGYSFFPIIRTNRWKFSAEIGYLFEPLNHTLVPASGSLGLLAADESGQVYGRIQAQVGF